MDKYFDILLERAGMVKNWKENAKRILLAARRLMPDARVYVFGSVVRGEAAGGSDVDVLIVSASMPSGGLERARVKVEIEELAGLPLHHPFELHLVNEKEARWYIEKVGREWLYEVRLE